MPNDPAMTLYYVVWPVSLEHQNLNHFDPLPHYGRKKWGVCPIKILMAEVLLDMSMTHKDKFEDKIEFRAEGEMDPESEAIVRDKVGVDIHSPKLA